MESVDCVVAGAGVVGLAVARSLALTGRDVLLLEGAEAIGMGTSSRNSEVIHAGIYYPAGSLMARHCVAGRRMLYAFCAERGVPHARCGKLIVATSEDEATRLDGIRARAAANGVEDMRVLSRDEALALEPALSCHGALLSPSTGIIDSHAYMLALQGDAENAGAVLAFDHAYYVERSAEKAFEAVAPSSRMTEEQLRVEGVERVPEGTTHCVDVRELSPTLLEVDLTEYPPGADPVLIRQRVRVAENPGGTWGIVSITPAG